MTEIISISPVLFSELKVGNIFQFDRSAHNYCRAIGDCEPGVFYLVRGRYQRFGHYMHDQAGRRSAVIEQTSHIIPLKKFENVRSALCGLPGASHHRWTPARELAVKVRKTDNYFSEIDCNSIPNPGEKIGSGKRRITISDVFLNHEDDASPKLSIFAGQRDNKDIFDFDPRQAFPDPYRRLPAYTNMRADAPNGVRYG